jgi:hypothetical protein
MSGTQDFYLSHLNFQVDAPIATIAGSVSESFSGDATVEVTFPVGLVQPLFQFSTDAIDINDMIAADILHKVVYSSGYLGLDLDTKSKVVSGAIQPTAIINTLTSDYARNLSLNLFGTPLGVDLLSNEEFLRTTLNTSCQNNFHACLLALAALGFTDGTGSSPSKTVLNHIMSNDPGRLSNITPYLVSSSADSNGYFSYKMPILQGDKIYFKIFVNPATGQHLLTRPGTTTPIPGREYLIKATIVADPVVVV